MTDNRKSILFISSANPCIGPGKIALDYVEAFRGRGYDVDFLTKYEVKHRSDIRYIYKKKRIRFREFLYKVWYKINKINHRNHLLYYRKENEPPVSVNKILKKIANNYDIVIIYFWQSLLSYRTVEAIYDKINPKPKIIFLCADYSPMTGGCHFLGNCKNYTYGCGNCPMLGKHANPDDFTAQNIRERIRINKKIKPIVITNLYMQHFFKQSPVMKDNAKLILNSIILNLNKFRQINQKECREELGLKSCNTFIIFFACQNLSDKRKGIIYLLEALNKLHKKMTFEEQKSVLIMTAGKGSELISSKIPFKQTHLGYVDPNKLPNLYSAADVYISPSIDDAGPSMVNQSIACGTPVIAFEMGTALEVIKDTGAGYCVPLMDTEAMADALITIYNQTDQERNRMRQICRNVAIQHHSYDSVIDKFKEAILYD